MPSCTSGTKSTRGGIVTTLLSGFMMINERSPVAGEPSFIIVNAHGEEVSPGEQGLLLFKGGTVCDDGFSEQSAHAICREMGYLESRGWSNGNSVGERQSSLDITLDDVYCPVGDWAFCSYSFTHNCGHGEDVYLACNQGNS